MRGSFGVGPHVYLTSHGATLGSHACSGLEGTPILVVGDDKLSCFGEEKALILMSSSTSKAATQADNGLSGCLGYGVFFSAATSRCWS